MDEEYNKKGYERPHLRRALEAVKQEAKGLCVVSREDVRRAHKLAQKALREGLSGGRQSS